MQRIGPSDCCGTRYGRTWEGNFPTTRSAADCIGWVLYGNGRVTFWCLIRSERKKRQIRRALSGFPRRSVVLVEDETDLLLFPPLRAMWSPRGQSAQVLLSGRNGRRAVFGAMNLV